jgi:hypothetical protein
MSSYYSHFLPSPPSSNRRSLPVLRMSQRIEVAQPALYLLQSWPMHSVESAQLQGAMHMVWCPGNHHHAFHLQFTRTSPFISHLR